MKRYEIIDGIEIYRHPLPPEARSFFGYIREYSTALFWEFWLSLRIYLKNPFQVIHGCNPPDLIFLISLPYKLLGVKFVFDHHDINPELYIAKFNRKDILYRIMLLLEKLTFKTADYSIATNNSYHKIAVNRGGMDPVKVTVVRSGPSLERMKIAGRNPSHRNGKRFLVGYVGVIGEQEGLDLLLESVRYIKMQRTDIQFAIIGSGTDLEKIKGLCNELSLNDCVKFYGRVSDKELLEVLNSCDVCVNPDKPTEMNNLSTMNKIMEYMALRKPIVQYDLKEGRASAKNASLYAENNNTIDFANKIIYLLDNPHEAEAMAEYGYQRVKNELSWQYESKKLIALYQKVLAD